MTDTPFGMIQGLRNNASDSGQLITGGRTPAGKQRKPTKRPAKSHAMELAKLAGNADIVSQLIKVLQ